MCISYITHTIIGTLSNNNNIKSDEPGHTQLGDRVRQAVGDMSE